MNEFSASAAGAVAIDDVLRVELAHSDAQVASIGPILRHLLANDEHSVFGDEIIARVRAMVADLARQLLDALTAAQDTELRDEHPAEQIDSLVESLVAQGSFLGHAHALALEWQLTERMQARLALDPVVSPLVQALVASTEPNTSANAMALLAQQARFAQQQRRMQLPLNELPADLFHAACLALQYNAGADAEAQHVAATAVQTLRSGFDESRSRLGLIVRLIAAMGGGASAALNVTHAGVGIFLSALAIAAGQDRDLAVLSTNEGQVARLALALRAAGLRTPAIEEQFAALHPDVSLPAGFDQLGSDRAAALLAQSTGFQSA